MKKKQIIRLVIGTLIMMAALDAACQTKVRDFEIVNPSGQPYEIFVIYPDTLLQIDQTILEYEYGWKYNQSISFDAKKGQELKTAFVNCNDTTFLTITGGEGREVYKGGTFVIDGGITTIGN